MCSCLVVVRLEQNGMKSLVVQCSNGEGWVKLVLCITIHVFTCATITRVTEQSSNSGSNSSDSDDNPVEAPRSDLGRFLSQAVQEVVKEAVSRLVMRSSASLQPTIPFWPAMPSFCRRSSSITKTEWPLRGHICLQTRRTVCRRVLSECKENNYVEVLCWFPLRKVRWPSRIPRLTTDECGIMKSIAHSKSKKSESWAEPGRLWMREELRMGGHHGQILTNRWRKSGSLRIFAFHVIIISICFGCLACGRVQSISHA
jgi:hypothetical protein